MPVVSTQSKSHLRIAIHDEPKVVTLKVEGRIAGPMVAEFDRTWLSLALCLVSRKLSVDLRGVTCVDTAGRCLLVGICDKTGAGFLADTPLTKYFAEEASRRPSKNREQEGGQDAGSKAHAAFQHGLSAVTASVLGRPRPRVRSETVSTGPHGLLGFGRFGDNRTLLAPVF